MKVSLAGLSTVVRDGVRVSVSETTRTNVVQRVGPITTEITVARVTPLVETSDATLGIVIDERKIVDLRLNGLSFERVIMYRLRRGRCGVVAFIGGSVFVKDWKHRLHRSLKRSVRQMAGCDCTRPSVANR
jgi:hypothetical protein